MKRIFFLLLLLAIGATLIMCTGEQKPEATTDEATQEATETVVTDTAKVVADTVKFACAGCGMEMEKAQMVSHEIDDETHYFCSDKCKEQYLSKKEQEDTKKEM